MCTGSDLIARVACDRLPYAENLVSGDLLGACGVRVRSGRSCVRGSQVRCGCVVGVRVAACVRGGGAWHRGWAALVCFPFQRCGHAYSLRGRARGGLGDTVSSRSAGSGMRRTWAGAASGVSFGAFELVAVWGLPMLLHGGQILCRKVPNNAYSQDSQEFGESAGVY